MRRARFRRRLQEEGGYSLIEMVVVMVILSVVMAGLTQIFVSGGNAEVQMNKRFQAQEQARAALDGIRADIHCAAKGQAQTIGTYAGLKLDVTACNAANAATWPAATISWCVVPVTSSPVRYQLYRSSATTNICTASDTTRHLVADYLVSDTNVFVTGTIPQYGLQAVAVDFRVNVDGIASIGTYELKDDIVARNSARCLTAGGCAAPTVP